MKIHKLRFSEIQGSIPKNSFQTYNFFIIHIDQEMPEIIDKTSPITECLPVSLKKFKGFKNLHRKIKSRKIFLKN